MKKEIEFLKNIEEGLFYGDIVEVVSENNTKQFLMIHSGRDEVILIDLRWDCAEWNRYIDPIKVDWDNLTTENFAEVFGFSSNVKVRKLARKTTLVYEYSEEINVSDTIRVKEFPFICGHVVYKTKREPVQYFIDEYQEGRVGLSESEIEKVST